MKILLINPPTANMITTEVPSLVSEERGFNPPLGIMYIAAHLEKAGYDVKVIDADAEELNYSELTTTIRAYGPDIVGLSAMSFTLIDCMEIAKLVKSVDKDIKIFIGGPHVNIYPEETIRTPEIDYVVLGEGEFTTVDLVKNIDSIKNLKKIKGLVFKENGTVRNMGRPDLIKDLDKIYFPARHLTPYKKYSSLLAKRSPITTMITSRGCPFRCLFCDRPHLGKIFRARSAKNVVDEMEECVNMGIHEFLIYDDTFTINRQRVLDICDEILARKLDIGFDVRARLDTVDREMLIKMKRAGCERVHYGVESGNEEILKILNKGITIEQAQRIFKITKKIGIDRLAYFMIGNPRETKRTIMQSIDLAIKLDPDYVHFSITTPFPATGLYFMGLREGIIKKDYWQEFAENPTRDFIPPLWEENLNRKELLEMASLAYKRFYTRPSYVAKRLLKVRSLGELKRKLRAGLKVVKL